MDVKEVLKDYFSKREDVAMAFLFGSFVEKRQTEDSDIDVAVYLKPSTKRLEWEEMKQYPQQEEIWSELVDILEKDEIDLIILNRANPTLAFDVLKTGIPLIIKDRALYLDFYLLLSNQAEDFSEFMKDYLRIKLSARSLSGEARDRLLQRFDYLITCWEEKDKFIKLDFETYRTNPDQRRNIERWVENITNVTIDIAKIILASEGREMPRSYKEALLDFGLFFGLREEEAKRLSQIAELRNLLAHEYLEILYDKIKNFLQFAPPIYDNLLAFLKKYLEKS
jgi:uncharacterized protein YutE (UPF0331/DUF86 family)/predicted nucleotidyltransferase